MVDARSVHLYCCQELRVSKKHQVILDIAFRRLEEVFCPSDLEHLHEIADIVWGRNEPMPAPCSTAPVSS